MVLRKLFRFLAVVSAVIFTVAEVPTAKHDYREWQAAAKIDHSAADLYRLNFEIDVAEILVAWVFAGGLMYVLREKKRRP